PRFDWTSTGRNESSAFHTRTPIHGWNLKIFTWRSIPASSRKYVGNRRTLRAPTKSSGSLVIEYGRPLRQSAIPTTSHFGHGVKRPRASRRWGASDGEAAYAFWPNTGHMIVSK